MIVVDASVLVDFTVQAKSVPDLVTALEQGAAVCAPSLVDYEFHNVLRKHVLKKRIPLDAADAAIQLYSELPLLKFDGEILNERIWQLRSNLTAYDASYVALAEILGARLYTGDTRIGKAAGHTVEIVLCRPAP